jgi:UDP-3-O-[3-hydroxymyristoyl] N-acetylglucosamine deacetylase
MAALAGCAIHNALIEIDGPEVPILDGSAEPFVATFWRAGLQPQDATVRAISVLRPVEIREGEAVARLEPADMLEIDFRIDFAEAAIGRQERSLLMANGAFVRELSDSRTFCRQSDVDAMRQKGLALGGTLENAVVFDGDRVVSPGGLRHADEPVRHKMLDALGDLALAGGPTAGALHRRPRWPCHDQPASARPFRRSVELPDRRLRPSRRRQVARRGRPSWRSAVGPVSGRLKGSSYPVPAA